MALALFDFPNFLFSTKYPETGFRTKMGNSYTFTAAPSAPDERIFELTFSTMFYKVRDTQLVPISVDFIVANYASSFEFVGDLRDTVLFLNGKEFPNSQYSKVFYPATFKTTFWMNSTIMPGVHFKLYRSVTSGGSQMLDYETDPQNNFAVLEQFYREHQLWREFALEHPVYGRIVCRFNKPLEVPINLPNGNGYLASFKVELIEVPGVDANAAVPLMKPKYVPLP